MFKPIFLCSILIKTDNLAWKTANRRHGKIEDLEKLCLIYNFLFELLLLEEENRMWLVGEMF